MDSNCIKSDNNFCIIKLGNPKIENPILRIINTTKIEVTKKTNKEIYNQEEIKWEKQNLKERKRM